MTDQAGGTTSRPAMSVGMILSGEKGVYRIVRPVSVSDRSMTYLCENENHQQLIVKYYNGSTSMHGEVRTAFLKMTPSLGVLYPVDHGVVSGFPFDIMPAAGVPLGQANLTLQDIRQWVIPQICYIIAAMHSRHFLVRDIRPENFRWEESKKTCFLSSFSDIALLSGNATATRAKSYDTDNRYCAPETRRGETSIYSDFYAVGVTIFHLLKGTAVFSQIPHSEIQAWKQTGQLPGSDNGFLRTAPLQSMTDTQKIQYLILGLTHPDPVQRWTYPEVRVWNNGYHIPLVQTSSPRVRYQMEHPILVNGQPYWDYDKLAQAMAENGNLKETEQVPAELLKRFPNTTNLKAIVNNPDLSGQAKLFRCIYILHPATGKLYWRGKAYTDSAELARKATQSRTDFKALQDMLKNRCLSFMLEQQKTQDRKALEDIRKLEELENATPGEGANRFIQQMAGKGSTALIVLKTPYPSFSAFLRAAASDPARLEKESDSILRDQGFRAYAWAKGHAAQLQALSQGSSSQAFWNLMLLLETMADDADKPVVRTAWISRTNYAPILHLLSHLTCYEVLQPAHTVVSSIRNLRITAGAPLRDLADQLPQALHIYQDFVRLCENNVLAYELGISVQDQPVFRPMQAEYAFSTQWNGIEVSQAFLWQSGDQAVSAQEWMDRCAEEIRDWLSREESGNSSVRQSISVDPTDDRDFFRRNHRWAVFFVLLDAMIGLGVVSTYYRLDLTGILIIAGLCLPQISLLFFWRYRYNVAKTICRTYSAAVQSSSWFDRQRQLVSDESRAIVAAMQGKKTYSLRVVGEEKPAVTAHGQAGMPDRTLKGFVYFLAYIGCFAATLLGGVFSPKTRYLIFTIDYLWRAAVFTLICYAICMWIIFAIQDEVRTSGIFWIVHLCMGAAFLMMSLAGLEFLKSLFYLIVGVAIVIGAIAIFFG